MHWSLCVVVNPGALVDAAGRKPTKDDPLSCMIFMDSLRMHNKSAVANHIRRWLNSEYNRIAGEKVTQGKRIAEETFFSSDNFPIFSPRGKQSPETYYTLLRCCSFVSDFLFSLFSSIAK